MKRRNILFLFVAAALSFGCAKAVSDGGSSAKAYLDAWLLVNHPDLKPTKLGTYVMEQTEGTGIPVGDYEKYPFIRVKYITRTLDGSITGTNYAEVAQQLGTYSEGGFYGPNVWDRRNGGMQVGIEDMLSDMKVGGKKTSLVPGWLMTLDKYDNPQDYVSKVTGTNVIYTVEVVDAFSDIAKWEVDSIGRYLSHNLPQIAPKDSLKYGFYYARLKPAKKKFENDTTIYINYTGRLLNGQVFDTTIKDTAKFYGIYSDSKNYAPTMVNFKKEDYKEITLGSSNVIDGFAYAISQMGPFESGAAVFYSTLGYGASGSGSTIPPYSPLRFDIEVVDNK